MVDVILINYEKSSTSHDVFLHSIQDEIRGFRYDVNLYRMGKAGVILFGYLRLLIACLSFFVCFLFRACSNAAGSRSIISAWFTHLFKYCQQLYSNWKNKYTRFTKLKRDPLYQASFNYLNYDYRIRNMIYTIKWIERLNKGLPRVQEARNSMPNMDSVINLLACLSMNNRACK